ELVQALRLEAVGVAQGPALAVEDPLEALARVVERAVHPVARGQLLRLPAELVDQLLDAHHAHVEAGELEAPAAHPLERLARREALHQEPRERVEAPARVRSERLLCAVPAAVDPGPHRAA